MGELALFEQAAPATPNEGVVYWATVATPSIPMVIDDAGNNRRLVAEFSGSWTPTIAGTGTAGTHTYTRQIGRYLKQGTFVYVQFYITINAKDGAMSGNAQIAGLPFTTRNISNYLQPGVIASWASLATAMVNVSIATNANATTVILLKATAATASLTAMVAADIQNGSELIGSICYEADS